MGTPRDTGTRNGLPAPTPKRHLDLGAIARQQSEPGWSVAEMEAYLRRFHYRLGPEDLAGLERFEALLAEHRLLAAD